MKVWEIQKNAAGSGAWTLTEQALPIPSKGQALIKMRAAALNYRDVLVTKNMYAGGEQVAPIIPLSDGVGEVVSVGDSVARVKVGDRVAGAFMPGWIAGALTPAKAATALGGGTIDGVLAEYSVLDEDGLVIVPEHLTDEEAATLPCAAVTAWYALFIGGNLRAGDTVLLLGTGGVSLFALQFAKLAGARVLITSSSDEKLARAQRLGADETINYRKTPEWDQHVMKLTEGAGVDYVVEVGGPGTINRSLQAVRYGGVISLMGVLTGFANEVSTSDILHKNVRVQGVYVGSREMFEAMNRAIAFHQLRPIVDRVFPFHEAPQALAFLESGAHFGKVVVRIQPS
jgi:NADPH:quinone reductase-like Zn-dependent oxidoreductase